MYRGGPKKRHNMWLIASFFKTAAKNLPQQLVFPVVRFSCEDFLIYDLIYQSQPHQPTSFLGVVVKAKTNPIPQTQNTSFVQSQKQKIEENPESENMKKKKTKKRIKKATFHCSEWLKGINYAECLWAKTQMDKSSMD